MWARYVAHRRKGAGAGVCVCVRSLYGAVVTAFEYSTGWCAVNVRRGADR